MKRRLANLVPAIRVDRARVFHGTNTASWEWIQANGAIRPRDMDLLQRRVEADFGLDSGRLSNGIGEAYRMYSTPVEVWTADCFATACEYAEDAGSEALFVFLLHAVGIRHNLEANSFAAGNLARQYLIERGIRAIVLAIDVPFDSIPEYRDLPDPQKSWWNHHPDGVFFDINLAITPPVPLEWIVAAIDPEQVDDGDRYYDPSQANIAFLMSDQSSERSGRSASKAER